MEQTCCVTCYLATKLHGVGTCPFASWPVELHPACEVVFGQATRSPSVRCDFEVCCANFLFWVCTESFLVEVASCRDCTKGFLVQGREGEWFCLKWGLGGGG